MAKAPRQLSRFCGASARGACIALSLVASAASAENTPEITLDITGARYDAPTDRYAHGVLGDDIEYGALALTTATQGELVLTLPDARVFEDTAPRLVDIDGDGDAEVLVVESHESQGARAALYDETGLIAATPYIGTRFRWLAPTGIGAADLDGDGRMEIAYVDRPHLAKTLRIWRYEDGGLTQIASLPGVTNHRIGETDIAGGIRDCGQGPEIIVADSAWQKVMAVTLSDGVLKKKDIGLHEGRSSFAGAMACES